MRPASSSRHPGEVSAPAVLLSLRELPVKRQTDYGADSDDRSQNRQLLQIRTENRMNDVGGDQKFEAQQKVVREVVPQELAERERVFASKSGIFEPHQSG